jgi:Tfp pilus assembly protein PilF
MLVIAVATTTSRLSAEPIAEGDLGKSSQSSGAKGGEAQNPEIAAAVARFQARDIEGALKLLAEAAKKDPNLPPAQVIMAQLFSQTNIPEGMRTFLEKATFEVPDDPEAYIYLGDLAIRERHITEADLLFQKAANLLDQFTKSAKRKDAIRPHVCSGLASVAEARADWGAAQKQLETWLKLDPKNGVAMQRLARCRFEQKDVQGALEKLREAVKSDPDAIAPEATVAQLYQQAGDQENAKKWLATAMNAAPNDVKIHLMAAQWAFEAGDLGEAKTQAEAAMKLDPKSPNAKVLCGVIALFQKDCATAEMYFESAHLQSPGNFVASNNLALALVEQKDEAKKQKALQYAATNVRQYPKVAEAVSTYGWVLYKLGRLDEAEQAFRAVATSGNVTADTKFYVARLSVDRGREAEAKQLLESALKMKGPFLQRQEAQSLLQQLTK